MTSLFHSIPFHLHHPTSHRCGGSPALGAYLTNTAVNYAKAIGQPVLSVMGLFNGIFICNVQVPNTVIHTPTPTLRRIRRLGRVALVY